MRLLAATALEREQTAVPVDRDLVIAADGGSLDTPVTTATLGKGLGAAAAAEQVVLEDDGAVRLVLVGRGVSGLDVQLAGRDGLRERDEGAKLEEEGLHGAKKLVGFFWRLNGKHKGDSGQGMN